MFGTQTLVPKASNLRSVAFYVNHDNFENSFVIYIIYITYTLKTTACNKAVTDVITSFEKRKI